MKKSKQPTTVKEKQGTVSHQQAILIQEQYSGSIPHPSILKEFKEIDQSIPERILTMAEQEMKHRHMLDERELNAVIEETRANSRDQRLGQIFGFIVGMTTILGGVYAAVNGAQLPGALIGVTGVAGLVSVFITGRKKQ